MYWQECSITSQTTKNRYIYILTSINRLLKNVIICTDVYLYHSLYRHISDVNWIRIWLQAIYDKDLCIDIVLHKKR